MAEDKDTGLIPDPSMIGLWQEMQRFVVHFNELIIKLRVQALAALAALTALLGLAGDKMVGGLADRYFLLAAGLVFFAILWLALYVLDTRYYSLMLLGAVDEILDVEERMSKGKPYSPMMSTTIRNRVVLRTNRTGTQRPIGVSAFYYMVLAALLLGACGMAYLGYVAAPDPVGATISQKRGDNAASD